MITFSLTLSQNQIVILQAIAQDSDKPTDAAKKTMPSWLHLSHFTSGVRGLLSEGLVKQVVTGRCISNGREIEDREFVITDKGRLILRYLEIEISESAASANALLSQSKESADGSHWKVIEEMRESHGIG